ncbi:hypothetical protein ACTQ45_07335 [Fundicoccus sp. Sow4_D5]|uniref:hypothetical protein n=1 Tax=unclassified Fundicoccus TaxID=2761543 RepID=UPI003F8DCD6E
MVKSYSKSSSRTLQLTSAAILTAVGILIPMVMPIKIVIGPASYTLGSHIPIVMAMFLSPLVALAVAFGTTLGFLMAGFPIIIVFRALSHTLFATAGAIYLERSRGMLGNLWKRQIFSFFVNVIHGLAEVGVVYFMTAFGQQNLDGNFLYTLFVLVGIGTIIHGMVDFELGYQFTRMLSSRTSLHFDNYDRNQ